MVIELNQTIREPRRRAHRMEPLVVVVVVVLLVHATSAASGQRQWLIQPPELYHRQAHRQQSPIRLDPPQQINQFVQGPGIDLVALNRRRFELGHHHHDGSRGLTSDDLRRAELIESQVAAVPERFLSQLPEELTTQLFESVSADPSLILPPSLDEDSLLGQADEDPDGASIERLTKSCLTVHASSLSPEQLNVTFHLFTRKNPQVSFVLRPHITRAELTNPQWSPFDPTKPIKWITHGFHTNLDKSEWMLEAKDKILVHEDANVFLTDWRRGASPALAFYPKAAANAHVVAKMIAKILRRLRGIIDLAKVHLIGHSLGAHIMGFVGSTFTEDYLNQQQQLLGQSRDDHSPHWQTKPNASQLIGRITACDPALPCFGPSSSAPNSQQSHAANQQASLSAAAAAATTGATSSQAAVPGAVRDPSEPDRQLQAADWTPTMWTHLRPDSAVVVEVMHSNPGVMGYADPLGDFDFYPNGNDRQPGCGSQATPSHLRVKRRQQSALSAALEGWVKPIKDFFLGYTCSHHRSVEYMVESMYYDRQQRVCQMVGYRCPDYQSFKKGFCFRCHDEHDCRSFLMPAEGPSSEGGYNPTLAGQYLSSNARSMRPHLLDKFSPRSSSAYNYYSNHVSRRVLPTFNHHQQNYKPLKRSQYYFDTRHSRDFCLNHYHLLIKYRWFRIRESLALESFKLIGTLGSITQSSQENNDHHGPDSGTTTTTTSNAFHRFTYQSYTMLLTHPSFLGSIESLVIFGDKLKPSLIDFIEVSFLSNLDPNIRALGSARLCRSTTPPDPSKYLTPMEHDNISPRGPITLFVRCSGPMVR